MAKHQLSEWPQYPYSYLSYYHPAADPDWDDPLCVVVLMDVGPSARLRRIHETLFINEIPYDTTHLEIGLCAAKLDTALHRNMFTLPNQASVPDRTVSRVPRKWHRVLQK